MKALPMNRTHLALAAAAIGIAAALAGGYAAGGQALAERQADEVPGRPRQAPAGTAGPRGQRDQQGQGDQHPGDQRPG